jgi:hypothetical protein
MNDFSPNETGAPEAHMSPSGAALKLLWSQEFDEAAGSSVDRAFWNFDIGDGSEVGIPGWGNQEREWYLPEQAATDGSGSLVITATKLPADVPTTNSGCMPASSST